MPWGGWRLCSVGNTLPNKALCSFSFLGYHQGSGTFFPLLSIYHVTLRDAEVLQEVTSQVPRLILKLFAIPNPTSERCWTSVVPVHQAAVKGVLGEGGRNVCFVCTFQPMKRTSVPSMQHPRASCFLSHQGGNAGHSVTGTREKRCCAYRTLPTSSSPPNFWGVSCPASASRGHQGPRVS